MKKYGLHGSLKAKKGMGQKLASILLEASKLMNSAEGCRLYLVSEDIEETDSIWVTEVWESKEHHAQSLSLDGVKQLIARAIPLLDGQPQKGKELSVLGGSGLD